MREKSYPDTCTVDNHQRENYQIDEKNYCNVKFKVPPGKRVQTHEPDGYEEDDGFEYFGPQPRLDISKYNPLYLVVEPSEFKIDPEKGTTFSITSLSKNPQDVIVTVHSYMFEIKDARRKLGITSQWFHVLKKDEKKSFEIVMKDLKDESMDNFKSAPYEIVTGHIEITHYKSRIAGTYSRPKVTDSDQEWGAEEKPNLLVRTACNDQHYCGYWRDALEVQFETESFKKRKHRFKEFRFEWYSKQEVEEIRKDLPKEMTTDQEKSSGASIRARHERWEQEKEDEKKREKDREEASLLKMIKEMNSSKKDEHSKKDQTRTKSENISINLTVERAAPATITEASKKEKNGESARAANSQAKIYAPTILKSKINKHNPFERIKVTDRLSCKPLYLVVEPKTFEIDPEKGTKYNIRSLSKYKQDVIVEVDSYLFEIKNPRGWHGLKTQVFHRLKHNEMMSFEIALRDSKSMPPDSIVEKDGPLAGGTIKITHYRTCDNKDDSDKDWNIVPGKHQMVPIQIYEDDQYGHWEDALDSQFPTEEVKNRKVKFMELNWMQYEKMEPKMIDEEAKKKVTMMTKSVPDDPEESLQQEIEEEMEEKQEKKEKEKWKNGPTVKLEAKRRRCVIL